MARGFVAVLALSALSLMLTGCPKKQPAGGGGGGGATYVEQIKAALALPEAMARARELTRIGYDQATKGGDQLGADDTMKLAFKACGEIEGDPVARIEAFCNLGEAQAARKRMSDAKKAVKQALPSIEKIEDAPTKGKMYARVGRAQGRCGDLLGAAQSIAAAEKVYAELDPSYEKVTAFADLASSYMVIQKPDEVSRVVDMTLQMADALESKRNQCKALTEVAAKMHEMKQPEEAKKVFAKAIATVDAIPKAHSQCYAMMDIAKEVHKTGDFDTTRNAMKKAELLANQVQDSSFKMQSIKDVAELMDKLNLPTTNE